MATRVAVQQQQRLFREGLGQLLEAEDDLELCGTAASAPELVRLCAEQRPQVVLLEADASGWDVGRLSAGLRRSDPGLRLIGLSGELSSAADMSRAKRAGMSALVSRRTGIAGILAALPALGVLTTRELHVLHLVGPRRTGRAGGRGP